MNPPYYHTQVEYRLLTSKGNVTGMIFWLKNNAGWTDEYKQKNENSFTFADYMKIASESLKERDYGQIGS